MKQRIPNFESFINESPMRPSGPKTRRVRAVKAILKDFQQSKWYTPEEIWNLDWYGNLRYMASDHDEGELADMFLTPGEYPDRGKAEDKLCDKIVDTWEQMKKLDPKIETMFQEWSDRKKAEKAEEARKEAEAKHKKEIAEAKAQLSFLSKINKLLPDLFQYAKRYSWFVKINPWMTPKTDFKKSTISSEDMIVGKYYIGRYTAYDGGCGEGQMFPAVMKYDGKKGEDHYGSTILSTGAYGPSVWTSVNTKPKSLHVANFEAMTELDEFLKANKNQLAKVLKKYDELWDKYKDEKALPFDPYWGMN